MFNHIMVPVDLSHLDCLARALDVAASEARHHDARVTYVSVTSSAPGSSGHTPEEFKEHLAAFAAEQGESHGITTAGHMIVSHDPSVDTDRHLVSAAEEVGADLVIMASHKPGLVEYLWSSHGGAVASHSTISVMLVRDP